MSEQLSYCPRCHNEVQFFPSGDFARCPICHFEYKLNAGTGEALPTALSATVNIGRVILKIVLIVIGIVVLAIAVLFAGCALALTRHPI